MSPSGSGSPVASVQVTSTANSRESVTSSHDGPATETESSSNPSSHQLASSPNPGTDKSDHLDVSKHRVRRSGGFLLDPTLSHTKRNIFGKISGSRNDRLGRGAGGLFDKIASGKSETRQNAYGKSETSRNAYGKSETRPNASGKGDTSQNAYGKSETSPNASGKSETSQNGSPGIDRPSPNNDHMNGRLLDSNDLPVDDRNDPLSDGLSGRSSPLSREVRYSFQDSLDGALYASSPRETSPRQPSASLDPSQLVQMALNLSEGRRRRVSASIPIHLQSPDKRRVRSSAGDPLQVAPGSSLANDQLRAASNPNRQPPQFPSPRPSSRPHDGPSSPSAFSRRDLQSPVDIDGVDAGTFDEEQVTYQFSSATINRAERAKAFFTLASEYRRMLSLLPPLKPDASARGNYTFQTMPAAAGASHQISRAQTSDLDRHDLGRDYNPLQLLRNRRVRHREQRPLDPPPEAFENASKVTVYVDQLVEQSQLSTYRETPDLISLPQFRRPSVSDNTSSVQPTRGHKRTDTTASRILKPVGDWSITPAELLADAIWLEQKDNKFLVENRRGNKIFPRRERRSLDSIPSATMSRDSLSNSAEAIQIYESDEGVQNRGRRKRKLLPTLRHVDNAARKHLFRQRARSSSSSSTSSIEQRNRVYGRGQNPSDKNVGPLDRHMRRLIQDEQRASDQSRDVISLDKPDRSLRKRSKDVPITETDSTKSPYEMQASPGKEGVPVSPTGRRYSFDDSTAPNSPYSPTFNMPVFGMSLSPPASRQASPQRKQGFFNMSSKQDQQIQEVDFATRQNSEKRNEEASTGKRSFESGRPNILKRHKTTASFSSADPTAKDTSVSRFFKGGRIGNILRSENSSSGDVIGKRPPRKGSLAVSDISDDDDLAGNLNGEPPMKRRPTDYARDNSEPRYHTAGLPTFRSHSIVDDTENGKPFANAGKDRDHSLKEKTSSTSYLSGTPPQPPDGMASQRPGPKRTNSVTLAMLDDGRKDRNGSLLDIRRNRSANSSVNNLGHPGSIRPKAYATSVANSNGSRPSIQGKRHWSISDAAMSKKEEQTRKFSPQDLARVRALFLASGVKARELHRRACTVVDPPSEFLAHAADTAGEDVSPVPAQDEYLLAAKLSSTTVTSATDRLRSDMDKSRSERMPALHARFEELKHQIDEKLMPSVQMTADEADAFTIQLTTHQTLAIKQVNDAVDNILRNRRRRLRILRKAGFAMLEWFVLGLLWVVWLIVVIIRVARGVVKGLIQGIRWFLWL